MSRIATFPSIEAAPAEARPFLEAAKKQMGSVPNVFRVIANSPAALEGFLGLNGALGKGSLDARTRERIALAVAKINGCNYCLSAHAYLGKNVAKLDDAEITANRSGASNDPRADAAVRFAAAIAGILGASSPAFAGPEINTTTGLVTSAGKPSPGLAVHGYDVVSYFTEGKPVKGNANFTVIQSEATYRFSSQANLDLFKANPAKYEPAYGGFCAFGVSVGAKFDGDPTLWKIVDGKLYLNLDSGIQQSWLKDVPGNLKKSEANWPGIKGKLPSQI
jgi:AhpD family alkylhydroperoxidase